VRKEAARAWAAIQLESVKRSESASIEFDGRREEEIAPAGPRSHPPAQEEKEEEKSEIAKTAKVEEEQETVVVGEVTKRAVWMGEKE
jgi:hypothetical protein